jgi:hypothetical protein
MQSWLVCTGFEQGQCQFNYYNCLQQCTWKCTLSLQTVICAGLFHWLSWQFRDAKNFTYIVDLW